jgi:uncharacterized spore protein YtfJ
MTEAETKAIEAYVTSAESMRVTNEKLIEKAGAQAVFSEPVTQGDYTVITAAEVFTAVGSGYGVGQGSSQLGEAEDQSEGEEREGGTGFGSGGGGGGGGTVNGRPVAVIIVGPGGVRVEPVVDVTKIGLAFLTTLGAMALTLGRMRRR